MGADDDGVSSSHLIRTCRRWIDPTHWVHTSYTSFRFLYIGAFERTQMQIYCLGGSLQLSCIRRKAVNIPCSFSRNPNNSQPQTTHKPIASAPPTPQTPLFSLSPPPPSSPPFTALTTHNGSTPPNTPINPPPLPLPSQTSTISTPRHPLHHK